MQKGAFRKAAQLRRVPAPRRQTWGLGALPGRAKSSRTGRRNKRRNQSPATEKGSSGIQEHPGAGSQRRGRAKPARHPRALRGAPRTAAKDTSELLWIHVADRERIHSSKASFEQEHNVVPGHPVYTRWPKYVTLNTSSLTLKEARNSNKHSLREIKLPKSVVYKARKQGNKATQDTRATQSFTVLQGRILALRDRFSKTLA